MRKARVSFQERHTTRVVRTQYAVGVWMGMTAESLQSSLARVPAGAKLVEEEMADNGDTAWVFELEFTEAAKGAE